MKPNDKLKAPMLTYGRCNIGFHPSRVTKQQKSWGWFEMQCDGCGVKIVLTCPQNRELNLHLFGVTDLPCVCTKCTDRLRRGPIPRVNGNVPEMIS